MTTTYASRLVRAHFAVDPFLAVVGCLDLLDLGDDVFLFLIGPRSYVGLGQYPIDPLQFDGHHHRSDEFFLAIIKISATSTDLAVVMHRLPVYDISIAPILLEVGGITRGVESGLP